MEVTQVKASHILVKTKEEAEQLRQDILDGKKTFEQAAAEFSQCPSGAKGGDLGFFGKGQMVKEFEVVTFELAQKDSDKPEDLISEPIQTQFGYHLIKLTGKK